MIVESFNLAAFALQKGARPRSVVQALQASWGYTPLVLSKRYGSDSEDKRNTTPGTHGIPEIGTQERAFYEALTEGQKEAYRLVAEMVEALFDKHKGWFGVDPWAIDEPIEEWKRKAFHDLATHPMKTYMVGQMLAAEELENTLVRPVTPTDMEAIEYLRAYTFNEIDKDFEELKGDLRTNLIEGMQQGLNPKQVASNIANTLEDYRTDWELISITETARAESQGRLVELQDRNITLAKGSSAHDSKTCDDCLRLINDRIVNVEDTVGVSNYGRKKADWVSCIPLHPRCIVEGAEVLTPFGRKRIERIRPGEYVLTHAGRFRRVLATASRRHCGFVFDVGGLGVTGEHPVLTSSGYRVASELGESAKVVHVNWDAWCDAKRENVTDSDQDCFDNRAAGRVLRDPSGCDVAERQLYSARFEMCISLERITLHVYAGYVYDLQVEEDESFIANGIAVHNCRCVWLPYHEPRS